LGNSRARTVSPHRGRSVALPKPFDCPEPSDLEAVRRWVRTSPRPTAVDLFCGAGGLSLGLQDAGFSVLVGADSDRISLETHAANLRGLVWDGDLSDPNDLLSHLTAWGIVTVDLVAGGVPCQPFSRAGRSKIRSLVDQGMRSRDDHRAHLWSSFLAVVKELRPAAVLLENVPDLATWNDGAVLVGFREGLRALGYWTDARLLDGHEYGVPQHRSRLFIVGLRDSSSFEWPAATDRNTLRDAIGDLPLVAGGQREEALAYSGSPSSPLQQRLRRGVPSDQRHVVFDHITRAVRDDDAEAFALLQPGQTYGDLPKRLQRYRSDTFTDKYKRLEWDQLSRSITAHIAKDGYSYIHPAQHRTLSIREAARVQTFPDWFRFAGHPSARYRQIGNAVPPLLGEVMGRAARSALTTSHRMDRAMAVDTTFRSRLLAWHADTERKYPWRQGMGPWQILMAEMCLHRTRADQVVPVFKELLRLAPTPDALLRQESDVRRAMRSLGLRWRADNLILVAAALSERFKGDVPGTLAELLTLPGVGDYVANAVLCFAYGRPSVLLDTNTERIVSRVRGVGGTRRVQMRMDLYDLAGSAGPDGAFNFALLDLGALVCRARTPSCDACPVASICATGAERDSAQQLQLAANGGRLSIER
jgi:DNA (cytosine-5)-methyltransferase 1